MKNEKHDRKFETMSTNQLVLDRKLAYAEQPAANRSGLDRPARMQRVDNREDVVQRLITFFSKDAG